MPEARPGPFAGHAPITRNWPAAHRRISLHHRAIAGALLDRVHVVLHPFARDQGPSVRRRRARALSNPQVCSRVELELRLIAVVVAAVVHGQVGLQSA